MTSEITETVQQIPLDQLHPFKNHPFRVVDDESMLRTIESVAQYGVLAPAIARPREEGGYEIVAGHRRHRACELVGLPTLPVIVRNMDDDTATITMADSNLQRETILPSERAFAYRMKLEAMNRQGVRTDLTSCQVGTKLRSDEQMAKDSGESARQIQRYIRLTYLIPELLDMVDSGKIAFNPAVELSFLRPEEQKALLDAMDYAQTTPSLSQAQRLKKLSQAGICNQDAMVGIMSEVKKDELGNVTIKRDVLQQYFPKSYTPKQMQDTIVKLLELWQKQRQRKQTR